jgi:hypothetical protein
MTEPAPEVGRWYSFEGPTPDQRGRPVRIRRYESGVATGRFADGSERLIVRDHLGDQVEDAVPGVTERCLICGGRQRRPIMEPSEENPWQWRSTETRPCPNCRGLQ